MCGRFLLMEDKDIEEIHRILEEINRQHYGDEAAACKTGEIFPSDSVPVLSLIAGKPSLSVMKWGFPKWDGKGTIINAKSETAAEKRMFARPLLERRCVIPSTGFFEWQRKDPHSAKTGTKYLINCADSPMLYMAGIYDVFKTSGQLTERFVVFTRGANRYMSDIHDRMPVILYKNELRSWLLDGSFSDFAFRREDIPLHVSAYAS